MFNTSPEGYALIKRFEGCKLKAYKPTAASNYTIGWGKEGQLYDGRPVVEGLTITQQEADDDFAFTMYNYVDPMVRAHFNCQTQEEFDACASWVYNISWSRLRAGAYTLPDLVNRSDRRPEAINEILDKWLQYWRTPGAETGLYRRRILETVVFLGLPWNVPAVLGLLSTIRAGDDPEPVYAAAEAYHDLSEDEQTAALNNAQAKSLGGKPVEYVPPDTPVSKPKAVAKAKPVETPKLDPAAPPKPMEKSTTAKGMAQQKAGADQIIVGGVTTTMAGVATAREVTKGFKEISSTASDVRGILFGITLEQLAMLGLLVGGIWLVVGVIRWQAGRIRKAVGRAEATEAKI